MKVLLKERKDMNYSGSRLLILIFGSTPEIIEEGEEDSNIFSQFSINTTIVKCRTIAKLKDAINRCKPEVFHLLAKFDSKGKLSDFEGKSLSFSEIMKLSELLGVRLLISASENKFEYLKDEITDSKVMNLMIILQKNRHYPSFLKSLIAGMKDTRNFAMAYVNIAPQYEIAQRRLPLPGSIVVCPTKDGNGIVLWTNAQE